MEIEDSERYSHEDSRTEGDFWEQTRTSHEDSRTEDDFWEQTQTNSRYAPSFKKISRYAVGMKCQDESEMLYSLYTTDRVRLIDPKSSGRYHP